MLSVTVNGTSEFTEGLTGSHGVDLQAGVGHSWSPLTLFLIRLTAFPLALVSSYTSSPSWNFLGLNCGYAFQFFHAVDIHKCQLTVIRFPGLKSEM